MAEKKFAEARKDFEESLKYDPEYKRAKVRIGTAYNNEGVDAADNDKAIGLFRKALYYDPDNEAGKKNLAQALYGKGAQLVNKLQYSYNKKGSLMEILKLLKEAHELDPYNKEIVDAHNLILDALRKIHPW